MRTKDAFATRGERLARWPTALVARLRRDVPLALLDVAVVVSAYVLTLLLLSGGAIRSEDWRHLVIFLPTAALIQLAMNHTFGLYAQMWRYASVEEAIRVIAAGAVSGAVIQ